MKDVIYNGTKYGEAETWQEAIEVVRQAIGIPGSFVGGSRQPADTRTLDGAYWRAREFTATNRFVFLSSNEPFTSVADKDTPAISEVPATLEKKTKKPKRQSRGARWSEAAAKARSAFDGLKEAVEALDEIRQEYEEWRDNLPENLANSALGEKLNTIADMDLSSATDDLEGLLDDVEGAEMPLGFGRD